MITLVYGAKGTGKTKRIIELANTAIEGAKGNIVYIDDNPKHSRELKYSIRFINTTEYGVSGEKAAIGFIKGILASDNDIEKVYIDGFARICDEDLEDLEKEFLQLEELGKKVDTDFILTISSAREDLPKFLLKYITE